jgi:hypothetical protein
VGGRIDDADGDEDEDEDEDGYGDGYEDGCSLNGGQALQRKPGEPALR